MQDPYSRDLRDGVKKKINNFVNQMFSWRMSSEVEMNNPCECGLLRQTLFQLIHHQCLTITRKKK
jgi:hypothetical protein